MERYKLGDIDNERFYMIPKSFFTNSTYRNMSIAAKLTYALLKDRFELSKSNGWHDENGDIYLIYRIEALADDLNINRKTVIKALKELKDAALIESVRQYGKAGIPNKIYIGKPETGEDEVVSPKNGPTSQPKKGTIVSPKNGPTSQPKNWAVINDTNNNDTEKSICNPEGVATRAPYQRVVELYHELCPSLPKVAKLTEPRKKSIKARWQEWDKSLDAFSKCFKSVEASEFLSGRNGKWSNCSFDWIMKSGNFLKIMEGNYNQGGNSKTNAGYRKPDGERIRFMN